ncbi:SIMPL domain-containing protein [Candidatus Planktophila versatilis]|uniref:SIMPL domain-containing protein n=1 Tax=Candidatus Planktophila versatilis TaxID=1884905 RepID=A0AAC9YWN4_9ACTN|nr:SIMPL domain-containing protein [Candidatus Planktophila versatilis]ASY23098.1 SIMPL domain-containing protein [Candidatus Planktophila versatilis]
MTTRSRISTLAVLTLAIAALVAPSANAAATRYITISSQGSVKVVPDAVRINATSTNIAATSKEALAATAKTSAAVRAALTLAKIDKKDIASTSVSVYPEYKYDNNTTVLVGYRASQSFTITVRAAATAGDVIDAIVSAGGDSLQLNGATPFVLDNTKAATAARTVAVKNARAKAASYASLLGVKLGKVNYLVENSAPTPYIPVVAVAKAESDATVVDLGEQDVTVSVTVQWSLL